MKNVARGCRQLESGLREGALGKRLVGESGWPLGERRAMAGQEVRDGGLGTAASG